MKTVDLMGFIERNQIEWHWYDAPGLDQKDVVIFVYDYQFGEFRSILHCSDLDDEGLEVILKDGYICVRMQELCDMNDINICDVFDINKTE